MNFFSIYSPFFIYTPFFYKNLINVLYTFKTVLQNGTIKLGLVGMEGDSKRLLSVHLHRISHLVTGELVRSLAYSCTTKSETCIAKVVFQCVSGYYNG
jgi:hypothetical protein